MLPEVLDWLTCPHCGAGLQSVEARTVGCAHGHRFDVARQGYLNLLPAGGRHRSDTAEMITARERFLGAGHYDGISEAIAESVDDAWPEADGPRSVLEAGAGTGHYLAALLDRFGEAHGLATDLSVPACRRAARAHPRGAAVVADTWAGLPVRDGCLDLVLTVFAPRHADEFSRVLRPGGALVVVTAGAGHLAELRDRLGLLGVEEDKTERLDASLSERFSLQQREHREIVLHLEPADVVDLVAMGPNAFHADLDLIRTQAADLGPLDVHAAVELSRYAPDHP